MTAAVYRTAHRLVPLDAETHDNQNGTRLDFLGTRHPRDIRQSKWATVEGERQRKGVRQLERARVVLFSALCVPHLFCHRWENPK